MQTNFNDVVALSRALHERTLTSEMLVADCLRRIAEHAAVLHAFIAVYASEALEAARQADRMISRGQSLGALHGIPIAVKDAFDIAGHLTGFGSSRFATQPAHFSCEVVESLQAAGAIILGKTHQVAFALGAWGVNDEMGTPRNPWDMRIHRVPGGSSSGSAVAVSAGLVPLALGTDTGGSVRVPAAFCGITGMKPCVDAISRVGVTPLSETLDSVGLFARSARDVALLFKVLRKDPTKERRSPLSLTEAKDLRLGRLSADRLDVAHDVRLAYEASLHTFEEHGAAIAPTKLPASFQELADVANTIMLYEGAAMYGMQAADDAWIMDTSVRVRLLAGSRISHTAYRGALAQRSEWQHEFAKATEHLDAWFTPTTPDVAADITAINYDAPPVTYTRVLNLLDLCGVSIPNGLSATGLPIGLQIAGRADQTDTVLALAASYQTRTDWHQGIPPLLSQENPS